VATIRKNLWYKIMIYCLAGIVIVIVAFPLFWMVVCSLKPDSEIYLIPPQLLPKNPTFLHYQDLYKLTRFFIYFKNSLIVTVLTTLITIIIATLGGYSLTRFNYLGRNLIGQFTLFAYLFPPIFLFIPLYTIMVQLGLVDRLSSLVVSYLTLTLPFALWLLRAYFQTIPIELEEAAEIDGASRLQTFYKIALPLSFPGIISTTIFTFILCWNEYLYALCFIRSDINKTLPPGVGQLLQQHGITSWGLLMAAGVGMSVPLLIFFSFLQKYLVSGFGAGAVKG